LQVLKMNPNDQTLLGQWRITQAETAHRKDLLGFGPDDVSLLAACREYIHLEVDGLVAAFYQQQTAFDEIRTIIGDADTLRRLHFTMREYVLSLFSGEYGQKYVNNRLRIGLLHKQIGVPPKLYLSAMHNLLLKIEDCLAVHLTDVVVRTAAGRALRKLLFFDTTLVFDTYVRWLVSEIETARDDLERHARDLEDKVAERTRELQEQARRDGLTGLYNRAALSEFLARDLSVARRNRQPLCLIYFDVDDFKQINDADGHLAGDRVLQIIAGVLRTTCRDTDVPCRYGGDEFCVLLPNSTHAEAEHVSERIIGELTQDAPEIKISIGVAQSGPEHHDDVELLLKRADDMMYQRKRRGKRHRPAAETGGRAHTSRNPGSSPARKKSMP
jgi:diguanylate cyclase (GGDEF)-like protein